MASFNGAVVGLLSNGKPNADALLGALFAELTPRPTDAKSLCMNKSISARGPAFPATEGVLEHLAASTSAVLIASGD
jgi:hypothetical protein